MKMNTKLIALLLAMLFLISACSSGTKQVTEPQDEPAKTEETAELTREQTEEAAPVEESDSGDEVTPEETEGTDDADVSVPAGVKLKSPFLVTTCGQSTGSVMFHMVANQAGLSSVDEHQLLEREMETVGAEANTLVITTGTSGKGMGAAGTDVDDEIKRCTAVAQKAKEMGMTIVCAHIEGMSRRTDASDQASIDAILPLADIIVCVEESNSDNYFSDYAAANNIPIIIVPDSLSLSEYME